MAGETLRPADKLGGLLIAAGIGLASVATAGPTPEYTVPQLRSFLGRSSFIGCAAGLTHGVYEVRARVRPRAYYQNIARWRRTIKR